MSKNKWIFTDDKGSFKWENPSAINELYFPLCNENGLMSAITPCLHGDIKKSQAHFLTLPVSIEDLHNSKAARNFWFYKEGYGPVSVSGNSAKAHLDRFSDIHPSRRIEAGLLWHKATFTDYEAELTMSVLSFIPLEDELELMVVTVTNDSSKQAYLTPTSAIPIYGRSAENIRDHRHVTSLVNRTSLVREGITMQPIINFDETGHQYNHNKYFVFGSDEDGKEPLATIGAMDNFIGEQGDLEWPESIVKNLSPLQFSGRNLDGKECIGGLRFQAFSLKPNESKSFIIMIGISDDSKDLSLIYDKYKTIDKVNKALTSNQAFWLDQAEKVSIKSGLEGFESWFKWVEIQPVFRKIFGCSFLPHHDYGKGGRGWRDLWQDLLSLILLSPDEAKDLLMNNFAGIRLDGSNATIIGKEPGEFIADRNSISRVWMDHGSWPYLTLRLYIDQSGDLDILLKTQTYFRDKQLNRAKVKDDNWSPKKSYPEETYQGSVLEHILVQHLVSFFNVGEHNRILLEGADWNDTLDMARERGESVAFTALYGSNLLGIAELLRAMKAKGIKEIKLFEDLLLLLDASKTDVNYNDYTYKQNLLKLYFKKVQPNFNPKQSTISINKLIDDLETKGNWIIQELRDQEFIHVGDTIGFFNSYYNNDGKPVGGIFGQDIRMYLTGQVFTTMYGLANDDQVKASYKACQTYLKDQTTGGYKLNTPLGPNKLNFGRGFSFAYGDKENGAIFSHMVVMYMNALYRRNFIEEGYEVFRSLFDLAMDTGKSKIYPGIPEYFNLEGKGLYHYLTGSASWLFLTVLTEMYGVQGRLGDLTIQARLVKEQFKNGETSLTTTFAERKLHITYKLVSDPNKKQYDIISASMDDTSLDKYISDKTLILPREIILNLSKADVHHIRILLKL